MPEIDLQFKKGRKGNKRALRKIMRKHSNLNISKFTDSRICEPLKSSGQIAGVRKKNAGGDHWTGRFQGMIGNCRQAWTFGLGSPGWV